MELSLFSRDAIAMATAIALSHNMFDAALYLGVCDKIVPGLLIGALHFGHLPAVFVPAGPMTSGMSNSDKVKIRQLYTAGKIGRAELLEAESNQIDDNQNFNRLHGWRSWPVSHSSGRCLLPQAPI